MARDNPPIRLAADPNTPESLRHLVDQARQDVPDASKLSRFGTRLEAAIAANVTPPTIELPQSTFATGIAAIKPLGIALGVIAGGVIAGSVWFTSSGNESATRNSDMSATRNSDMSATTQRDSTPLAPTVAAASAATVVGNTMTTGNSTADSTTTTYKGEAAGGTPKQQPAGRDPSQEATLLLSARSVLASNPTMALRITKEHARRFPSGNLGQEREVIAIEALRRLGQRDAAQKRATAFERQYPGSAHRSKIEQTLQGN